MAGQSKREISRGVPKEKARILVVCLLLAAATWFVFGPTLHDEFVNYDDGDYVFENPQTERGLSLDGVVWAFTHPVSANWHPLTTLSHMLDCQLYGLDSGGHHLTNVLLHATTVILLFLVLRQMTGALWRSAFVAALFAIHPLRAESVAWVSERKDVLSGVFFMLTLGTYTRYVRNPPSLGRYMAVIGFLALGLMSKPTLVTLPFVLLLLDYWPLNRFAGSENAIGKPEGARISPVRLVVEKIPLFLLAAGACAATVAAQRDVITPSEGVPLALRLGNAMVSYVVYIVRMFYPRGLAPFYPFPGALPAWEVAAALLLLTTISAAAVFWRKKHPYLLVGWLWYLGVLAPMIGLMREGGKARADRYTYLSQIGLSILVTWGVAELRFPRREYRRRMTFCACGVFVIAALMICARNQVSYWRNSETLWLHTLACTSGNFMANNNLGVILFQGGRTDEAISRYRTALKIKPAYAEAHNNLGAALLKKGEVNDAIDEFRKALEIKPDYAECHGNLGNVLSRQGKEDEAISEEQRALELNPNLARGHANLGNVFLQAGRVDEAIPQYREALKADPNDAECHGNLGEALCRAGRLNEAIDEDQKSLDLNPELALGHYNLGNALFETGRIDDAIAQYEKALKTNPGYVECRDNYGMALLRQGRADEAILQYQKALEINPDDAEIHYHLGTAFLRAGKPEPAISHFEKALEIRPNAVETENSLAAAFLQVGNLDGAITHFQKALQINPGYAEAWNNLGNALFQKKMIPEAISDYQKALKIKPDLADARRNLLKIESENGRSDPAAESVEGTKNRPDDSESEARLAISFARQGRLHEAIVHFQTALRIEPGNAEIHENLGKALLQAGQIAEALSQYRKALEIDPAYVSALNDLSWALATCPQEQFRNGIEAVSLAQQAERLASGNDPSVLDTLAAAYAEAGRFPDALDAANRALTAATTRSDGALKNDIRARLKLYQSGVPFRDSIPGGASGQPAQP